MKKYPVLLILITVFIASSSVVSGQNSSIIITERGELLKKQSDIITQRGVKTGPADIKSGGGSNGIGITINF